MAPTSVLKSARDFMEEVGAHTPESQTQFDNLGNMEKNLQVVKRSQNENSELIETLEKTFSSNVRVRCNVAPHALALDDWEKTKKDESKLPEAIQILLKGIRRQLEMLREKNAVLDALTNKLNSKFIQLIKRKSPIAEEEMIELEIIAMELESEIEIAESWQKKADDAWNSLDSEATSYIAVEEKAAKYKVAAGTCISTGAALAGGMYYGLSKLATGTAGAASGLIAFGLQSLYQIRSIHRKYEEIRAKIAKIKVNVDDVRKQDDSKIKAANIQKLAEKKLKVKDNEKGEN